jgi:glyoxylase-like metal-dependent hydrolase (beta-lactamase superfamily II)
MDSGSYHFHVGAFECIALSDGAFNYPIDSLFANVPVEQVQDALRQHQLSPEQITTPYTCLLINTGDHRVLIDTGAGNLGALAAKVFPTVNHATTGTGSLVKNLQKVGIQPTDIDTVVITHAHPDHIGGTLDPAGRLTFANANYFIHPAEWEFWTSEVALTQASPAMVQIARSNLGSLADRLTCIDDRSEIVPGIQVIATPGHTPGHIAVEITSGGTKLLHIADVVLYPLHLEHPTWVPMFDIAPQDAADSKRRIFDQAAAEHALVFAHHFPPFPSVGHVVRHGEGWQWQPISIKT